MDPSYAQQYASLYRQHWWWRAREAAVLRLVRAYKPKLGYGRILDVGCGDGLLFDRLCEFGDVEGVEPNLEVVSPENPARDRIHVVPFNTAFEPQQRYGLILMLDVLEHMPAADACIRRANDLLADKGILIATVPAFQLLWTGHDVINHHFRRYTHHNLRQLAVQAGFQVLEQHYWFQWLFPVKLAVRFLESSMHRSHSSLPSVPPALLNRVLYALCRLESSTISRLPMPFGTSVAMVAQKAAPERVGEVCSVVNACGA